MFSVSDGIFGEHGRSRNGGAPTYRCRLSGCLERMPSLFRISMFNPPMSTAIMIFLAHSTMSKTGRRSIVGPPVCHSGGDSVGHSAGRFEGAGGHSRSAPQALRCWCWSRAPSKLLDYSKAQTEDATAIAIVCALRGYAEKRPLQHPPLLWPLLLLPTPEDRLLTAFKYLPSRRSTTSSPQNRVYLRVLFVKYCIACHKPAPGMPVGAASSTDVVTPPSIHGRTGGHQLLARTENLLSPNLHCPVPSSRQHSLSTDEWYHPRGILLRIVTKLSFVCGGVQR